MKLTIPHLIALTDAGMVFSLTKDEDTILVSFHKYGQPVNWKPRQYAEFFRNTLKEDIQVEDLVWYLGYGKVGFLLNQHTEEEVAVLKAYVLLNPNRP